MSLWQKAYETYENHKHLVGVIREGHQVLAPFYHTVKRTQIEVTINQYGELLSISIDENATPTIIPVTTDSAVRTSNICAHPLSDNMSYLTIIDGKEKKHESYLETLSIWAESSYSHPKVKAIYKYIKKETLASDFAKWYPTTKKIDKKSIAECYVRWSVIEKQSDEKNDGWIDECWKDNSLFLIHQQYQEFITRKDKKCLCTISGKTLLPTRIHPSGIIERYAKNKLISQISPCAKEVSGHYGYDIVPIGLSTTQKIHNAIQWIIANQGDTYGGRVFVCWNPKGKPTYKSSSPSCPWNNTQEEAIKEPSDYKKRLHDTIAGYKKDLPEDEDVVIASFDASTDGRLSVVYYNELKFSDYYDRIEKWYSSCCIENQSPLLIEIISSAYGTERNGFLEVDDKVLGEQFLRLHHCMIDASPIPADMVHALQIHASEPTKYEKNENREKVLFAACAVIRKYLNDRAHKEEWSMVLDKNNNNRSYLFGRLLAVMEHIERGTFDKEEKREPNAIRLQTVYCNRPFTTAKIIEGALNPYFQKLDPKLRVYYKKMIDEIYTLFKDEDAPNMNRPLEAEYLLGYHLQRNDFYKKKNETENTEENEQ